MDPVRHFTAAKNIHVEFNNNTPSNFVSKVSLALINLSSGEVGQRLLKKIGKGRHIVIIQYTPDTSETIPLNSMAAGTYGVGSSSIIKISQDEYSVLDFNAKKVTYPFFVELAHELIHAYHNSYGKNKGSYNFSGCKDVWTNQEEFNTIMKPYSPWRSKPKISENAILAEHGFPLRFSHQGANFLTEKKKEELKFAAITHQVGSIAHGILNPHQAPSAWTHADNVLSTDFRNESSDDDIYVSSTNFHKESNV